MNNHMLEIEVYTKNRFIVIEQPRPHEDSDIISLTAEQIDLFITWLLEAKEELNGQAHLD